MARLIEPEAGDGPVNDGERRVTRAFTEGLPEGYIVIPNFEIGEPGGQRFEYDLAVVAPHGVYVVEVKDWRGRIVGDTAAWLVNGRYRKSPVLLTERKAKVLKSKLVDAHQALARVRVEAMVVLASSRVRLDLGGDAAARVFSIQQALAFVTNPAQIRQEPASIAALKNAIVQALLRRGRSRHRALVFGDYQVIEVLEQDDEEALYRARHKDMPAAPEVRLRVVTLSPYLLTEQQRAARKRQLFRDLEALLTMGSHPNVVAARSIFEDDSGRIVVVLDATEGQTLRQRLSINTTPLTVEERIAILVDVCRGLTHAHAHGVVHRRVEPENVLIDEAGTARLARFGLAKLPAPHAATVWDEEALGSIDRRYLAPELNNPNLGPAGAASDLYGLGCLAYELFAGTPPFDGPERAFAGSPPPAEGMPDQLAELLPGLLRADPAARASDTKGVLAALEDLQGSGRSHPASGPKISYEPQDVIDGKFEVRARLGGGGFSDVYRVYHALEDRELALKIFNSSGGFDKLQRELQILRSIDHPNVVRVIWADQTQAKQWYLLSELVTGQRLDEYTTGGKRLAPEDAKQLMLDLLSALEYIHPDEPRIAALKAANEERGLTPDEFEELQGLQSSGIVHRDIKPQNLVLSSRGIVLIDFNIASRVGDPVVTLSGTPPYQAPDANFIQWTISTDLFATGVVLYELLCGHHPYSNGEPRTDRLPHDPRRYRPELAPALCEFLLKACAPMAEQRFATAREMRAALDAIDPLVVKTRDREPRLLAERLQILLANAPPNVNPFVREFLALGSQARRTNRATRGLSDLAEATYVHTRLDERLTTSLLEGRHRLVVITGNAGDGKTAFIQRTEALAVERGARIEHRSANGSRLVYARQRIITLYDGSQDEEQRTSDRVLQEFFAPFATGSAGDGSVRVAAINEGRLRDFLLAFRGEFPGLSGLLAQLDDPAATPPDDATVLVNLNLRSVTAGGADSIFIRLLQQIVGGPFWEPCQRCDYRARCPIKHNVDTLRDPTSGPAVAERLRRLVDLVRLRRRRHLTMRDARSLISFLLFRDRTCEEIAELLNSNDPMTVADLAYFQGIGGLGVPEGSTVDRVAELLAETDVALVANAVEDRELAQGRLPRRMSFPVRESDYPFELIAKAQERAGSGYESDPPLARRAHDALRRLVFFERSDDGWWHMLPFGKLRSLEIALESGPEAVAQRAVLRDEAILALSAAEGIRDQNRAAEALWLATNDDLDGGGRSYRRFSTAEFDIRVAEIPAPYVEAIPDRLELIHTPSGVALPIGVDVLEVLERLQEGHVPSLEEARGFLVNLRLFKHRLLAEPSAELVLVADDRTHRIVKREGGQIELLEGLA
jgi:serine/threonine protein kinase